MTTPMTQINLTVPLIAGGNLDITLTPGVPLYIVGANGTGKSALVQHAVKTLGASLGAANICRISAQRQNWMDNSSIDMTPNSRQNTKRQIESMSSMQDLVWQYRWQEWSPSTKIQATLYDLMAKDTARAMAITDLMDHGNVVEAQAYTTSHPSVFRQLNDLLKVAGLSVTVHYANGEIQARRGAAADPYSVAQMSDGERNAVLIAADVLSNSASPLFVIDEPERHLHRSITEPFLSALFDSRPDCPFIVSTHEIALPLANPEANVLVLYSCQWNGPAASAWDARLLEAKDELDELPEELKRAILGARKGILFVEGEPQSLDQRLYPVLFPNITVRPAGSCDAVIQSVKGLQGTEFSHDIKAFGLIDRDSRGNDEVANLVADGVYALDAYAVECLYYCSASIAAVAHRQAETFAMDPDEMIREAKHKVIGVLNQKDVKERMITLLCERNVKKQFLQKMTERDTIKGNASGEVTLTVKSPYREELNELEALLDSADWDSIVARYPIHKSGALAEIAKVLHLQTKRDYEQAIQARIPDDQDLADALRKMIPGLTDAIAAQIGYRT